MIDAAVIMEYLEEVFPHRRTFVPADPLSRTRMRALIRFVDEVPAAAIRVPSYNLASLPHFQTMSEEAFRALADAKPLRREFLLRMRRTGFSEADRNEALDRLRRALQRMDDTIRESGAPGLLGARIGLAAVAVMPVIVRMVDIALARSWSDRPAVACRFAAIRGDPAFAPTYDAGSLLTGKYRTSERARRRIGP